MDEEEPGADRGGRAGPAEGADLPVALAHLAPEPGRVAGRRVDTAGPSPSDVITLLHRSGRRQPDTGAHRGSVRRCEP